MVYSIVIDVVAYNVVFYIIYCVHIFLKISMPTHRAAQREQSRTDQNIIHRAVRDIYTLCIPVLDKSVSGDKSVSPINNIQVYN